MASGGHSSSRCAGLSLLRPLLLRSTGSRRSGSVIVAHGPICSVACGIFPDQGSNSCLLHWQVDSQPLRHQGSPGKHFFHGQKSNTPLKFKVGWVGVFTIESEICQVFKTFFQHSISTLPGRCDRKAPQSWKVCSSNCGQQKVPSSLWATMSKTSPWPFDRNV